VIIHSYVQNTDRQTLLRQRFRLRLILSGAISKLTFRKRLFSEMTHNVLTGTLKPYSLISSLASRSHTVTVPVARGHATTTRPRRAGARRTDGRTRVGCWCTGRRADGQRHVNSCARSSLSTHSLPVNELTTDQLNNRHTHSPHEPASEMPRYETILSHIRPPVRTST